MSQDRRLDVEDKLFERPLRALPSPTGGALPPSCPRRRKSSSFASAPPCDSPAVDPMDGQPHAQPAASLRGPWRPPLQSAPGLENAGAVGLTLLAVAFAVVAPLVASQLGCVHKIPEGHVGVYWRGGALLKGVSDPGYHMLIPFITEYEAIQVTMQTDQVTNIPCGTKGGVMIYFDTIEVVNRLLRDHVYSTILQYGVNYDKTWIYDKIHHEINQFCSMHSLQEVYIDKFDQIDEKVKEAIMKDLVKYAPGIEIIGVRVTKPKIPPVIARNYEQMEEERTKVLIAKERQQVVEKEAETERKAAVSQAEKEAEVSRILQEQRLSEKESWQQQQQIENAIFVAKERALADAHLYKLEKEAEGNRAKLTDAFLELKFIEALGNNSKIFFGNQIPQLMDQRLLSHWTSSS